MSARGTKDLDYRENVYALVLAIVHPSPLSAEQAFKLLGYEGPCTKRGFCKGRGADIYMLREIGCSWTEIEELTGCHHPQSTYTKYIQRMRKEQANVVSKKTEKAE